jgi:hypothetical protein
MSNDLRDKLSFEKYIPHSHKLLKRETQKKSRLPTESRYSHHLIKSIVLVWTAAPLFRR